MWIEGTHRQLTPDELESLEVNDEPWDPTLWGAEWVRKEDEHEEAYKALDEVRGSGYEELDRLLRGKHLPVFQRDMEAWTMDTIFQKFSMSIEQKRVTDAYEYAGHLLGRIVHAIYGLYLEKKP